MRGAILAVLGFVLFLVALPGAEARTCEVFPLVHLQHCLIECGADQLLVGPGTLCDFDWGGDPPIIGPSPVPLPPI